MSCIGIIFSIFAKTNALKYFLFLFFTGIAFFAKSQSIENIYVNLYTDSLKKGTFNYINIDGKLANGKYLPLDSTQLVFWSSAGNFTGNSLWIDRDYPADKVDIKVTLRKKPTVVKQFTIYIKKQPDPELKTMDEIMAPKNKTKKG